MKLYLHVGHGKTGSSALQSWLSLNAPALWNQHQICYPETSPISGLEETAARQLKFSMGNGFILHEILQASSPLQALHSLCHDLGPGDKLFFSREAFVRELAAPMEDLMTLTQAAGVEGIHLLLYLRDPLEHAHSLYGQMVKTFGLSDSISDWLPRYNLLEALESFLIAIERHQSCVLTVHNYSRAPESIFDQCSQWLGGTAGLSGLQEPAAFKVNRTLCNDEIRLMRRLNQRFGKEAPSIGRKLVEVPASPHASPYRIPVEAQQRFLEHIGPTVARINSRVPAEASLKLELLPDILSSDTGEIEADQAIPLQLMPHQIELLLNGLAKPS